MHLVGRPRPLTPQQTRVSQSGMHVDHRHGFKVRTGEDTSTAMSPASSSPNASSYALLNSRTKLSKSSEDGDPNRSSGCETV